MPESTPTTFTWEISNLDRETVDGYVYTAHYRLNASDGTYTSGLYGTVGFDRPEGDLIPYADLTSDQVILWVKSALGGDEKVTELESLLQSNIDEQRAPRKASGVPW